MENKKKMQSLFKKFKMKDDASVLTQRSRNEKILFGVVFAVFFVYGISMLMPFIFLGLNSLKDLLEYAVDLQAGNVMALPDNIWKGLENYVYAFREMKVDGTYGNVIYLPEMIFNSLVYIGFSIFSSLTASSLVAYCLAKYRFKLHGFLYGIAIFSMTIPIVGTSGASLKLAYDLGTYNTLFYTILPSFGGFGGGFLVLYGYFRNIPWSYAEAVFIDGGGHGTVFFKIMLPQASPALLTLGIMSFIGGWNNYTTPLMYMPDYPTLASGLYKVEQSFTRDNANFPAYFAGLMLATIPVVVVFAAFSDVIMKNFSVGGLKG
ncbi:MAG: carbohydrate ABC transporter permease [Clostridia bacterium]|nr:carbohydrate ABC transporter permease [Clostridia bacterium]